MGMHTTIYGYIEEMDFWVNPIRARIRRHNHQIIRSLPVADNWPPVSKEMFAVCSNYKHSPGPNFEYSARIIHFGANLKSVEHEWEEWKTKFEALLLQLFFTDAVVHFKPEYAGIQTNTWAVNFSRYEIEHDGKFPRPVRKDDWDYESPWNVKP